MACNVLHASPRSDTVKNQSAQNDQHGVLETTAQAIGSTLGSLAVKTGFAKPPVPASTPQQQPHTKHARRSKKKK
jgi:hypothetical protein